MGRCAGKDFISGLMERAMKANSLIMLLMALAFICGLTKESIKEIGGIIGRMERDIPCCPMGQCIMESMWIIGSKAMGLLCGPTDPNMKANLGIGHNMGGGVYNE
eukprot:TRINITY_DN4239_c0_g6_i2.p3 TRINITY_DN4239_c0_g6~~TRINITY_DN4239_c0_g6_i2.p3  ORF type:complete len:105 (-),score=12.50 TRINITY_DN4239_c0_g6_i2:217-531(-)